jgi:single-stranded-DNA-specific exonuclease
MKKYNIIELKSYQEFLNYISKLPKTTSKNLQKHFADEKVFWQHIAKYHKIVIVGDYDVDGVTATAIAQMILEHLGHEVKVILPNRFTDGYGMKPKHVDLAKEWGADLILTVDNGMKAYEALDHAEELGIPVLVTDHHTAGDKMPNALLTINPHYSENDIVVTNKEICGAATMFYLARYQTTDFVLISRMMELAALATVADCMPIEAENRTMVNLLIDNCKKDTNYLFALDDLIKNRGINRGTFNLQNISFDLAPFLNAAGRLKTADLAFNFLSSQKAEERGELYLMINELNEERKSLSLALTRQALDLIDPDNAFAIAYIPNVCEGVVGIVAAKLVEKTNKPAFVFTNAESGIIKGSGRTSGENFNLLANVDPILKTIDGVVGYGGHAGAMGLSFKDIESLNEFRTKVSNIEVPESEVIEDVLKIDFETDDDLLLQTMLSQGIFDSEFPLFYKKMDVKFYGFLGNSGNHSYISGTMDGNDKAYLSWFFKSDLDNSILGSQAIAVEFSEKSDGSADYFVRDVLYE